MEKDYVPGSNILFAIEGTVDPFESTANYGRNEWRKPWVPLRLPLFRTRLTVFLGTVLGLILLMLVLCFFIELDLWFQTAWFRNGIKSGLYPQCAKMQRLVLGTFIQLIAVMGFLLLVCFASVLRALVWPQSGLARRPCVRLLLLLVFLASFSAMAVWSGFGALWLDESGGLPHQPGNVTTSVNANSSLSTNSTLYFRSLPCSLISPPLFNFHLSLIVLTFVFMLLLLCIAVVASVDRCRQSWHEYWQVQNNVIWKVRHPQSAEAMKASDSITAALASEEGSERAVRVLLVHRRGQRRQRVLGQLVVAGLRGQLPAGLCVSFAAAERSNGAISASEQTHANDKPRQERRSAVGTQTDGLSVLNAALVGGSHLSGRHSDSGTLRTNGHSPPTKSAQSQQAGAVELTEVVIAERSISAAARHHSISYVGRDAVEIILFSLGPVDTLRAMRCCRSWRRFACREQLWTRFWQLSCGSAAEGLLLPVPVQRKILCCLQLADTRPLFPLRFTAADPALPHVDFVSLTADAEEKPRRAVAATVERRFSPSCAGVLVVVDLPQAMSPHSHLPVELFSVFLRYRNFARWLFRAEQPVAARWLLMLSSRRSHLNRLRREFALNPTRPDTEAQRSPRRSARALDRSLAPDGPARPLFVGSAPPALPPRPSQSIASLTGRVRFDAPQTVADGSFQRLRSESAVDEDALLQSADIAASGSLSEMKMAADSADGFWASLVEFVRRGFKFYDSPLWLPMVQSVDDDVCNCDDVSTAFTTLWRDDAFQEIVNANRRTFA